MMVTDGATLIRPTFCDLYWIRDSVPEPQKLVFHLCVRLVYIKHHLSSLGSFKPILIRSPVLN